MEAIELESLIKVVFNRQEELSNAKKEVDQFVASYLETNKIHNSGDIVKVYDGEEFLGEAFVGGARIFIHSGTLMREPLEKIERQLREIHYSLFKIKKDGTMSQHQFLNMYKYVQDKSTISEKMLKNETYIVKK